MRTTILTLVLMLTALSALAGERPYRSPAEKDHLITKCVSEYGEEHSERCVEIVDSPRAKANRARRNYYGDNDAREIQRMRKCLDDPNVVNPRFCARNAPHGGRPHD